MKNRYLGIPMQLPAATDTTGSLTVACASQLLPQLLSYSVRASTGGAGSYAARRMSFGAYNLQYQLYGDAARTAVWGNGAAGTVAFTGALLVSLLPVTAPHTVYARLPALQTGAAVGVYTDTVTVTLEY